MSGSAHFGHVRHGVLPGMESHPATSTSVHFIHIRCSVLSSMESHPATSVQHGVPSGHARLAWSLHPPRACSDGRPTSAPATATSSSPGASAHLGHAPMGGPPQPLQRSRLALLEPPSTSGTFIMACTSPGSSTPGLAWLRPLCPGTLCSWFDTSGVPTSAPILAWPRSNVMTADLTMEDLTMEGWHPVALALVPSRGCASSSAGLSPSSPAGRCPTVPCPPCRSCPRSYRWTPSNFSS